MSKDQTTGYVDNLFDRAKAVRFEELFDRVGISVQKHGEELRGICPIPAHSGEKKKPSFYVNPDKQVFNCFGCKAKGNIVTFAQAYNGLAAFESKQAALPSSRHPIAQGTAVSAAQGSPASRSGTVSASAGGVLRRPWLYGGV